MQNLDEMFQSFPETVYPSNLPVAASEIPGWLRLERGEIHLFLASRKDGEYGRRHYVATLHPGDCFPACPVLKTAEDGEFGYLLVPWTNSCCRHVPEESFAKFAGGIPLETAEVLRRRVAILSAPGSGDAAECSDLTTLPEMLLESLRKTREMILRQEREAVRNAAAEKIYQQEKLQDQFVRLQKIVGSWRQDTSRTADPLLAALQVIAGEKQLRIHVDPPDEQEADPESRLIEFCEVNQWRTRRIQLESGFSRLHHGAMIGFHGSSGRPCILELAGEDSVWYFPGEGTVCALRLKNEPELRDFAYCFYENFPGRPLGWRDLVQFLFRGSSRSFLCICVAGILVGLFGLVMPVATAYVTGKIIPTANTGELWQLLTLLLALTTGTVILNVVPQLCLLLFGSSVLERFLSARVDRIFGLPVYFFHRYSAGDLCTRLFAAIRLQELTFQVVSQQFISSIFSLCSIIVLFYYSWKLTLVAIPMVLLHVFILYVLFQRLQPPLRTAAEKAGWESGFLKQVFDGIAKIRGAGAEERIENHFLNEFATEKQAHYRFARGMGNMIVLGVVIPAVINLVFFYLFGKTWRGSLEVSGFLAFLNAYGSFQAGVVAIGEGLWQLASQKPELERLEVFLKSEVETPEG